MFHTLCLRYKEILLIDNIKSGLRVSNFILDNIMDFILYEMLQPKRLKFRKHHRGKMRGKATRGTKITFGQFGITALEQGWIKARQIESGRRVLTRYVRRNGKLWICIYPDKPITFRAAESRMGAGKGTVEEYVAVVKTNKIIYNKYLNKK